MVISLFLNMFLIFLSKEVPFTPFSSPFSQNISFTKFWVLEISLSSTSAPHWTDVDISSAVVTVFFPRRWDWTECCAEGDLANSHYFNKFRETLLTAKSTRINHPRIFQWPIKEASLHREHCFICLCSKSDHDLKRRKVFFCYENNLACWRSSSSLDPFLAVIGWEALFTKQTSTWFLNGVCWLSFKDTSSCSLVTGVYFFLLLYWIFKCVFI